MAIKNVDDANDNNPNTPARVSSLLKYHRDIGVGGLLGTYDSMSLERGSFPRLSSRRRELLNLTVGVVDLNRFVVL